MKRISVAIASAVFAAAAASAQAGLIIDGGYTGASGPDNDVIGTIPGGYYGANLKVDSDRGGRVTFSFVGSEAAWNSYLGYGNDQIVNHPAGTTQGVVLASNNPAYQQQFGVDVGPGTTMLDFFIKLTSGKNMGATVYNGSNTCPPGVGDPACTNGNSVPNYWLGYEQDGSVLIAMDDGGQHVDDNHDDLVVRATYAVPEPGSLALLGLGLVGLGIARRRRKH